MPSGSHTLSSYVRTSSYRFGSAWAVTRSGPVRKHTAHRRCRAVGGSVQILERQELRM